MNYEKLGVFYLGREYDAAKTTIKKDLILYDSRDLTTHAVCVGMTGSGKTGLCLALIEEAAIDGVPVICIDPKGDLGNLLLTFPALAPQDFVPWVDSGEAARAGLTVDAYATQTAETWKKGLAEWDEGPERIARFRDSVDIAIYTPGSETGLPLNVMRSFAPPSADVLADSTALRDRMNSVVSGLLNLLGRDADPVQSREHILLANILERAWREGTTLDMAGLIAAVQKPPLDKVGAFDIETFFPAKDRTQLAMAINNLLASPGFAAWMTGEPLDAQRLLFTPEGKPRISIISIAHLSDAERMFVVTLMLNELVTWMRAQSGTASLRALFYMDEIFGYFPPSANPPSKIPMLTLLKQARAFGLGCVLATQNPVDLDYKGLGNAGTWLIGRLQTERDKLRVLDGLESALAGAGNFDRASLDRMMSGLTQRVFLMRNVHDDAPVLMKSRWALSYLRGPLTGPEISRLMAPRKKAAMSASGGTPTSAVPAPAVTPAVGVVPGAPAAGRPALAANIKEYFLAPEPGSRAVRYRPMVIGLAKLHFVEGEVALDQWLSVGYLAPLSGDGSDALWDQATSVADLRSRLAGLPDPGAAFDSLPGPALRAASYAGWGKSFSAYLYEKARATVLVCDALATTSAPAESIGDFRARLALKARERRDGQMAELRQKYAANFALIEEQIRRAAERVEREKSQLSQQKLQTAISVGATILGAFLGRKAVSVSNIGRATTAMRTAGRIGRESGDVDRANEGVEVLNQRLADLHVQFDAEIAALAAPVDPATISVRSVEVTPRKSDISVEVALAWAPRS
jgi:hypothetical protein